MQIQVNTDHNIEGHEELRTYVESLVEGALGRFGERVTRVEVHITDENSGVKGGSNDKRCMMEARLSGRQPTVATHTAASIDQAVGGAIDKLEKILDSTLERVNDHRGGKQGSNFVDKNDDLHIPEA